jgi:hypothetical protein
MLHNTKDLEGFSVGATDGSIGKVKDFYFDDEAWVVRYLVVDTGKWLADRRVLIAWAALGEPNLVDEVIPAALTQSQVRQSPDIDTHKPISRQQEEKYLTYYGYANYWGGAGLLPGDLSPGLLMPAYPGISAPPLANMEERKAIRRKHDSAIGQGDADDPHLRSSSAVTGYHVHATDGDIGHVDGLLLDPHTWAIRFLIVNTSNWWVGHRVMIATRMVRDVSWANSKLSIALTRDAVKGAHVYDDTQPGSDEGEYGIYGKD